MHAGAGHEVKSGVRPSLDDLHELAGVDDGLVTVGGASTASAVELLEREDALATLHGALRSVLNEEEGRLVLVRGEAGVGKTAVVQRFCSEVGHDSGLTGACDSLFTPRPLGPIVELALATGGELESA